MRVIVDENPELARKVSRITLDGKPVPLTSCVGADEEEGWVESLVPLLPEELPENGQAVTEQGLSDDAAMSRMKVVRRTGKVEITIYDNSSVDH